MAPTNKDTRRKALTPKSARAEPVEPPTMEKSIILQPMMNDSLVTLGDLWDCHTSTCPGNLFKDKFTSEHLEAFPVQCMDYTLYHCKNTGDKMNMLKVSGELKLDILLGAGGSGESGGKGNSVSVEGSVSFESTTTKKFHEEQLFCQYDTSTYMVRVKPAAQDLIDPIVKTKIRDKSMKATHFVQSVRLGGQATATISYSENIDSSDMNLKGSLKLDAIIGPVTLNAQVEAEMLDKGLEEKYTTSVTVTARPKLQKIPTTVGAMFEQIELIDMEVGTKFMFPDVLPNAFGVPLSFKLVPIAYMLPDYEEDALYKLLADGIMEDFSSMVFTCRDFEQPDYIKGLLREKDPRLVTILRDVFNPFTAKVTEIELECAKQGKVYKADAFKIFSAYKEGKKTVDDIQEIVLDYNDNFYQEGIIHLMDLIQNLVGEARLELTGIHASDVVGVKGDVRFMSNSLDLGDWWSAERKIKVLLKTKRGTESPAGTFLKLYNLAGPLDDLGVEIGVAFPNISDKFSLTFKIHHETTEYEGEDIVFALEILAVAVESGSLMSSLYYTLNGVLSGLDLTCVKENLPDAPSLVTIYKEYRGTKICETYPALLAALELTADTWNFVIPLQAINSSVEMMKFFRQMKNFLPKEYPRVKHQWIVGKFNVKDEFNSPLLFVFRDSELRAICLDHLDILILLDELKKSAKRPDLSLIHHTNMKKNCLYPPRANFALKILEGLVLDHATTLTDLVEGIPAFPKVNDLSEGISVNRAAAQRDQLLLLNTIGKLALVDDKSLEEILTKYGWTDEGFLSLENEEWIKLLEELQEFLSSRAPWLLQVDGAIRTLKGIEIPPDATADQIQKIKAKIEETVAFVTRGTDERVAVQYLFKGILIDETKYGELKGEIDSFKTSEVTIMLRGVHNALQRYFSEQIASEDLNLFNLTQLKLLIELLAGEEGNFKAHILEIAQQYAERSLNKLPVSEEKYADARKKIGDAFAERNVFKAVGQLSLLEQDPLIYELSIELYNLQNLYGIEGPKKIIENMGRGKYNKEQLKTLWYNPKFVHLMRKATAESEAVLETIFIELCIPPTSDGREPATAKPKVPRFIPKDIAGLLKPYLYNFDEPEFELNPKWRDVHSAIQVFQILVTRKFIPQSVPKIFRQNIEINPTLCLSFQQAGALFYWNSMEKLFNHPWSVHDFSRAVELLMNSVSLEQGRRASSKATASLKISAKDRSTSIMHTDPGIVRIPVSAPWKMFTRSGYINKLTSQLLFGIASTLRKPFVEYNELFKTMDEILPYLCQQAKAHNSSRLQPNHIAGYIKYPPTDGTPRPGYISFETRRGDGEKFLMSKGDLLTVLFNCADPIVTHQILLSMTKTTMALPLVISDITTPAPSSFTSMTPSLKNIIIQELEGIVPSAHLLGLPFRFVCSIRVGETGARPGKSSIINKLLMADEHCFSSFLEPGVEHGKPISRSGLLEFTWLSKSRADSRFYNEVIQEHYDSNQPDMILLGNLHGDALTLQPILEFLKAITSSWVVFWKTNNWNDLRAKKQQLGTMIGTGSSVLDLVLYPDTTIPEHVGEHNIIRYGTTSEDEASKRKLYDVYREAIACKPKDLAPIPTTVATPTHIEAPSGGIPNPTKSGKTKSSVSEIKMLSASSEGDTIACPESSSLIAFIFSKTVEVIKAAVVTCEGHDLPELIRLFMAMLQLPLAKRNSAFVHFIYELDHLSRVSSKMAVERVVKLRRELQDMAGQGLLDDEEIADRQNEIKAVIRRLQATTLTAHDIWRYFSSLNMNILDKYVEYLQSGFSVELFQPTYGLTMWAEPMATTIQSIPADTRVFVISAIGMKASGKSSLLNRLFGEGFTEGPAGCTNGLQMRFLWVNLDLRKELKCDAFCIVDSEGFGSAENLIDPSADLHERNMAAFLVGISQLTLVSVFGDSMQEISDILEIAFTSLTKLKDMMIAPDLLLIQQQVESETPDAGIDQILDEWEGFMDNVKSITRENEIDVGIRVREAYRMESVRSRLKHEELVHVIRPCPRPQLANKETNYHADIQELYKKILSVCKNSASIQQLGDWYSYTEKYWKSIQEGATTSRFKNVDEMRNGIVLSRDLEHVFNVIDIAFRTHNSDIDEVFTEKLQKEYDPEDDADDGEVDPDSVNILNPVHSALRSVINTCEKVENGPCDECKTAFAARESLLEAIHEQPRSFVTVTAIEDYTEEIRGSLWGQYKQRVLAAQIKFGKSDELKTILYRITKEFNDKDTQYLKFKQHLSTLQTVVPSEHRMDAEVISIYASLPHILTRIDPSLPAPNLEAIVAFDLGHYNSAVESSLVAPKRERLSWEQNDWLLAEFEDLPGIILSDSSSSIYQVGMIRDLKNRVGEILTNFQNMSGEQLEPDFKWECHLVAIRMFRKFMGGKQAEWNGEHNPLVQLEKRKAEFPDLFE